MLSRSRLYSMASTSDESTTSRAPPKPSHNVNDLKNLMVATIKLNGTIISCKLSCLLCSLFLRKRNISLMPLLYLILLAMINWVAADACVMNCLVNSIEKNINACVIFMKIVGVI